jgi:hypothetical protein
MLPFCASAHANLALRRFACVATKLRSTVAQAMLADFACPDLPPDVVTNTLRDRFPNPLRGIEGMHRRVGADQDRQSCKEQLKNAGAGHRLLVCCGPVTHGAGRGSRCCGAIRKIVPSELRRNSSDSPLLTETGSPDQRAVSRAPLSFEGGWQVHAAQSRWRGVCADATPPWRVPGLKPPRKEPHYPCGVPVTERPVMGGDR